MKHLILTFLISILAINAFADSIFMDSFEYANHDNEPPIGWTCDDQSWLCGYLDKDHNRAPHTGNWYAYTDAEDSWMFMPLYFSSELKYRFSFWAISDGTYEVEFWLGNEAGATPMEQLLFSKTISGGDYEKVSFYIESISSNYQYFGIHAVAAEGAYHLTLDDVNVDMVGKYDFDASPSNADTVLFPNSQATHHFEVQNLGYEPIDVILSPSHEYFTDIHFFVDGEQCTVFHLEPDETKAVTAEATLLPSIPAGTTCWLDIMLVLDCNCATSMTTLWVTVITPSGVNEDTAAEASSQVEYYDLTGRLVDATHLKPGIYIKRTVSPEGVTTRKVFKK